LSRIVSRYFKGLQPSKIALFDFCNRAGVRNGAVADDHRAALVQEAATGRIFLKPCDVVRKDAVADDHAAIDLVRSDVSSSS
jgi:hypothetical protein